MFVPSQALRAVCASCCENNCHLELAGLSRSVNVLDLNRLKQTLRIKGRISDCAVLWNEKQIFAIVELKGGQAAITIDRVVAQIQGGLDALDGITWDQHVHDFYPILMYHGKDPTPALRGQLVVFRGTKRRIIPKECGSRLSSVPHR